MASLADKVANVWLDPCLTDIPGCEDEFEVIKYSSASVIE